jgi:MFS family permease
LGLEFVTLILFLGSLASSLSALVIGVLRASRQAVLPLWADHVGIGAASIGVIFGISSAMDMTLFYPAGSASDRWGRKFVALPCMSLLAAGFVVMPLARTFAALVAVGLLLGFGNGLGSGIVMTLGADFSPSRGRAEFLGVWRTVGDVGTAGGPMLASAVIALFSLGPASVAIGAVGIAGAVVVAFAMPEPLHRVHATELVDAEE